MFDLGWGEMLLIGVVALIVVGPKDLPNLFRQVGHFTGKARGMAREFSRAMEAAADDAGVKDIDRTIRAAANPVKGLTDSVRNSLKDAPTNRTDALKAAGISSNPAAAVGDMLAEASKPVTPVVADPVVTDPVAADPAAAPVVSTTAQGAGAQAVAQAGPHDTAVAAKAVTSGQQAAPASDAPATKPEGTA